MTEKQLYGEFRHYAVAVASDGAPYLVVAHALAFVKACQMNDLAVFGMDGHAAHCGEQRLEARGDLVVDCSTTEAADWQEFRDTANSFANAFLREREEEQQPNVVFEFVLWSASEYDEAQGRGIEVDTGAAVGRKLRISPDDEAFGPQGMDG